MAKVTLHIYDVTATPAVAKVNDYIGKLGTGAFHGAVEIFGEEWSYGFTPEGTGVFSCPPKGCDMHHYRESVEIGDCAMSKGEVAKLIETLKTEWPGSDYDLLKHNCCVFSNELCQRLGVGPVPSWVTNLAAAGATVQDGAIKVATGAQQAAIIAAAKAGEIDEKYNIRGTCQAKAQEFLVAANGINQQYKIQERANEAAQKLGAQAMETGQHLLDKAKELDQKHHLQERAATAAQQAKQKLQEGAAVVEREVNTKGKEKGCPMC